MKRREPGTPQPDPGVSPNLAELVGRKAFRLWWSSRGASGDYHTHEAGDS